MESFHPPPKRIVGVASQFAAAQRECDFLVIARIVARIVHEVLFYNRLQLPSAQATFMR